MTTEEVDLLRRLVLAVEGIEKAAKFEVIRKNSSSMSDEDLKALTDMLGK